MNWKDWAKQALVKARELEDQELSKALEYIESTGYEPYFTLKYAVLDLEERLKNEKHKTK